jgi:hypothetical protein
MNGQQFIDALHQLEDNNETGPIVGLCAENAVITNPHVNKQHARPQGPCASGSSTDRHSTLSTPTSSM